MADYIMQMKKEIREKTAYFISFNLFLLVILLVNIGVLPNNIVSNLSLLSSIFVAGFSILTFAGDFYRFLDKTIGKCCEYNVQKISLYIVKELTKPCSGCEFDIDFDNINQENDELRKINFSKIMDLFYKFIPPDHTERERSFAYFTDYYITLNYLVVSLIFLVISLVIVLSAGKTKPNFVWGIIMVYVLMVIFSALLCRRYSHMLIYPTKSQIQEILTTKREELLELLPKYRICCKKQGQLIPCYQSGKCPLIPKERKPNEDKHQD
ncbi:MAG: hypothetical protein XD43_1727 [Thermococcales archaeon 44_46]|nr:MAG: hypothetical protein XD43_1727 [Thermococcales archaeon 44_46]HIH72563.1 hypothetical protein [Thermococcaceae archaeon]